MRGVLLPGNRQVIVRDFPDPRPDSREVVVRMRVAAICGSDLHIYRAAPEDLKWRAEVIPGHEPSGDVVAVGDDVRNVREGDRVAVYHFLGCGNCKYCLSGYMNWCPNRRGYGGLVHGSDADLLLTNEMNCLPLPPELSYVDGAFIACQASTAFEAITKIGVSARDTIVIFGLGPVGLCGLLFAKAYGARVVGVDLSDERLELAHGFGADALVRAGKEDVVSRLKALSDGDGPSSAFETSGSAAAHQAIVDSLGKGGRAVFVGFGARWPTVNLTQIIEKQLTLVGSFVSPIHRYWDLAAFLVRHHIPLESLVTHRFRLEDAAEAFRLADTMRTGKVIFEWS